MENRTILEYRSIEQYSTWYSHFDIPFIESETVAYLFYQDRVYAELKRVRNLRTNTLSIWKDVFYG